MNSEQSTITVVSANLGRWLGPQLPESLATAAREYLRGHDPARRLRGAWVMLLGDDLHLHLTTFHGDFPAGEEPAAFAGAVAREAALAALAHGFKIGLGTATPTTNPLKLGGAAQEAALDLRRLDFPFTERGAEPIFVAKALNASWGFFNRALFNLYFNPDKGSGHRIEGNDFRAVVESIADLRSGKLPVGMSRARAGSDGGTVRTFTFGPAEGNELLALVTDSDEWRLSEVYAVRGRFGEGKYRNEPAARVGGGRDPVLVGRCQSGLPAVGEFTQAVGEFYFGPGGEDGGYRVGLVPSTFAEAHVPSAADGVAKLVAYAYQSYDKGRIPEGDVADVFAQNPPETRHLQRDAMQLIRHMTTHGEFEPYLNAATAVHRAEQVAEELGPRFHPIPDGIDPLVQAANRRAVFTVSDIKADAGGKVGHTAPPRHFAPVAEASLREAKEAGLIFGTSEFIAVGDDGHLLMTHARGADDNAIHLLAYRTFFRQVWVAEALGYRWYGLGQDLVGASSAGKKTEELAGLTPRFLAMLPEYLPEPERRRFGELRAAFDAWRTGAGEGRTPAPPFAGNVSGQGPGFAELPLPRAVPVGLLAIDKAGPAAFNLPVWEALRRCHADGTLARSLQGTDSKGIVVEIWDVERHRRVFLDFEAEAALAQRLLGATDKFNIKRIWTRRAPWDPARSVPTEGRPSGEILGDILLAASTEKLAVISGGEYLGKDDPVLLAVEPLANGLNLFLRDRFYMTQGDGRGSHNMFPTPLAFGEAIATVNSRAVSVSAMLSFDARGEIRGVRDVFADPAYDEARERAFRLNKAIWDAHGGNFSPVGVGASKVEKSYPLAKMIARITAPGSPFEATRRKG
jgi:fructose 1,6-bisphosphate aldolase/phosphatase